LRIAKEIEPEAVGLFLIGAVMTLQTGSDVKFQPRLIEGISRLVGDSNPTSGSARHHARLTVNFDQSPA
jgi:hypothetical protein